MDVASEAYRQSFSHWLRTGRWPSIEASDEVELKFNPYHDPRNGQFTFAPGGPRSLSDVIVSYGRRSAPRPLDLAPRASQTIERSATTEGDQNATLSDAVYRPGENGPQLIPLSSPRNPRAGRGSNSRAFQDPLTLQQAFPALGSMPGGAILAIANNIFDITGPVSELTSQLTLEWSSTVIRQIQLLDPDYHFESLGFPQALEGQIRQLDDLRFDQAAAFMRVKGELKPLQLETFRFVQNAADRAYAQGLKLLRAGKLKVRLSEQEALGNFIDRQVRITLRKQYDRYNIEAAGKGPVRVNRREHESSSTDLTFRRPDARVGNIAFDVTLTRKTLSTPQVRGFFRADFKPSLVIIIRPRQIGPESSYIISRPEVR